MASHVVIPRGEYQELVTGFQRAVEICSDVAGLRFALQGLAERLPPDDPIRASLESAVEACRDATRFRVELSALERRLREHDQELTPVRPPSRTDIKAAFDASVEFASGKKKPEKKDE